MSKTHVSDVKFTRAQMAEADEVIDMVFERHGGRLRLDAGTPKSKRLAATARAVDAQVGRRVLLRLMKTADRFRLIHLRLLSRLHRKVLSFFENIAIRNDIVAARHDRERSIGRYRSRERGRQEFAKKAYRPILQY